MLAILGEVHDSGCRSCFVSAGSALRSPIRAVTDLSARTALRVTRSGAAPTVTDARSSLIRWASSATGFDPSGGFIEQIATNAADYDMGRRGQHLPKGKQLRLWKRTYDTMFAALITFEELANARRVRARAEASEN